jgi:hypothetical protein
MIIVGGVDFDYLVDGVLGLDLNVVEVLRSIQYSLHVNIFIS